MKQRAVILSLYFKSEKKTFPALFNVIVTKNYSLCARYSNMLSESWETFHFIYTTALRVSFRKSFLMYFSDTVWRQHGVFAEELCVFEQVILTLFAWFEYPMTNKYMTLASWQKKEKVFQIDVD